MEEKNNTVNFTLKRISTEQFAIIETAFTEGKPVELSTSIRFGIDKSKRQIGIFSMFQFEVEKRPFMIIEGGCHFIIEENSWKLFLNDNTNAILLPKGLMIHLTVLTIGTVRGILHAKTEGTKYNQFYLPTINVTKLIKEDVAMKFEENK